LNGKLVPLIGFELFWSNAPNLTTPFLALAKTNQLLGNVEANSSNLILLGSYVNSNCKPPTLLPFVSTLTGISIASTGTYKSSAKNYFEKIISFTTLFLTHLFRLPLITDNIFISFNFSLVFWLFLLSYAYVLIFSNLFNFFRGKLVRNAYS
jgi:hypothetical protein